MAIKKIEGFIYTCDRCGVTHTQDGGSGHYTNSCPPGWLRVDVHGEPRYLDEHNLCAKCSDAVVSALMPIQQPVVAK